MRTLLVRVAVLGAILTAGLAAHAQEGSIIWGSRNFVWTGGTSSTTSRNFVWTGGTSSTTSRNFVWTGGTSTTTSRNFVWVGNGSATSTGRNFSWEHKPTTSKLVLSGAVMGNPFAVVSRASILWGS